MMKEQIDHTKDEIREMDKVKAGIERVLEQLSTGSSEVTESSGQVASKEQQQQQVVRDESTIDESRIVWSLFEENE